MIENIHINEQILQKIEWKIISDQIHSLIHFKQNLNSILSDNLTKNEISSKLTTTKLHIEYLYENSFNEFYDEIKNLSDDFNAQSKITQIKKELPLSLADINEFAKVSEIFIDNFQLINKYYPKSFLNLNQNDFKRNIHGNFLKDFRRFVSRDGEVNFERHPLLAPLYQKQQQLELQIRSKLNNIMNSELYLSNMQFNALDLLNDRYVLPIKSDSFNKKHGQIIARSESGNTLFVEPVEISQLNYQRIEAIVEIQEILSRIEREITLELKLFEFEFQLITTHFYLIDEFVARAQFAIKLKLTEPIFTDSLGFNLKGSFHPLISNPVKNDVSLTARHDGFIISGPNTGGKTATLKMLCLTQIFLKFGLFIPCDYGEVYLYDKTYYFGNDNQDLSSGLSSFSAEVENYIKLLEDLGDTNLILIDEIFNSTSSEEASALAISLFDKIKKTSKSHIVISSHHQTLKTVLHQQSKFISAHVGFDIDSNAPTYKIHIGSPGSSHALRIFDSMTKTIPTFKNVYSNALNYLDNQALHYEKMLESLSQKEHKLQVLISENAIINKELKNQKQSNDGILKLQLKEKITQAESKIKKIIIKADDALKDVKNKKTSSSKKIFRIEHELVKELKSISPHEEIQTNSHSNLSLPSQLIVGQEYFCLSLNKTIKLKRLENNKKDGQVSAGKLVIKVPLNTLRVANSKNTRHPTNTNDTYSSTSLLQSTRSAKLEYDCRGMRLEEFKNFIQNIESDILLSDVPFVSIIHGHGDGVLKSWIRSYITRHKELKVMSNESGNDGETRIVIK